ncbi:putative F-box/LRR-repeat protein At4g13960 isoform X3 [Ananas comosus]|uniref:F-box/LRR-repeat protein At4g13960 isoform X3 n=1 Tax=Ananas comosus TaxID=4615 RepID=A0A6P5EJJ2_ANACO|nr:putative F-box/LRR-repeat protein At4g13960 isoform X3 [Ananas comosus]
MEHSKTVSQFQQNAHTRDHISELPDDILNRIFSLLTLRDAAKAKLLSRRWRRHPTFVSNLCLDPLTMFGIQIGRHSQYLQMRSSIFRSAMDLTVLKLRRKSLLINTIVS